MQQFQVPQFVSHEAQLIGPFTVKQTVLAVIIGLILVVLWNVLATWLFFLLAPIIIISGLLIIFVRINGRPMIDFIGAIFGYFLSPQMYIWQKRQIRAQKKSRPVPGAIEIFEGEESKTTTRGVKNLAKQIDE